MALCATKPGTILVVDACGARQNSHNEQNFPWADGHLNPHISFVDHLTPQALPIRRSYFVNFVHSVQKILSLIALLWHFGSEDPSISVLHYSIVLALALKFDWSSYSHSISSAGIGSGHLLGYDFDSLVHGVFIHGVGHTDAFVPVRPWLEVILSEEKVVP